MKSWDRSLGSWLVCSVVYLLAVRPCFAQEKVIPEGAEWGTLYCMNDSGELRCIERKRQSEPAALPTRPQHQAPAASAAPEHQAPAAGAAPEPVLMQPLSPTPRHAREIFVAVNVNGRTVDDFARVLEVGDGFYATAEQFANWRLKLPVLQSMREDGREYFPLHWQGVICHLDTEQQVLFVSASPAVFLGSILDLRSPSGAKAMPSETGLFLNHDVQLSDTDGKLGLAGLMELGIFSKMGVLTTRFLGRDLTSSRLPLRLDTQLVRDFPDRRATLTFGDAVSAPTPWSRQVHYGGIRWASKFSTQPGFVPFVLPALSGQAAQPSTVDIFVNNVRTAQQLVDTGPFSIHNVPVITGQGEIRMVVTDVLGRQQVVTQSYISTPELLRKGISEYAYEAGSLRRGFGTADSAYSSFFAAGTQRLGISDSLTLNFRGELLAEYQTFGVGADYAAMPLGLVEGGIAISRGSHGSGTLLYGQVQHKARSFGFSATLQAASSQFQQLGLLPGERPAKIMGQFQISHALGNHGSVSVGLLDRQQRDSFTPDQSNATSTNFKAVTSSASFRVARSAFLGISTSYSPNVKHGWTTSISLVVPLGRRKSLVANSGLQGTKSSSMVEVSQQLPVGNGYGYRLRTNLSDTQIGDAGLWLQNSRGKFGLEASRDQGKLNWRLSEMGGLVWMKSHVVLSRWLDDSFALVEVPQAKGVRVFANNQFITTTSRTGLALVPRLVPYDRNTVHLDDTNVPLQLGIDFDEKTVVPMPRSGVLVRFAALKLDGALFTLLMEDGNPVPLGAEATVNNNTELFQVALRGEVFVPNLSFPAKIRARWETGQCEATVPSAPGREPLPRIGPVVCRSQQ